MFIVSLVSGSVCTISFNYDDTKIIDSLLSKALIINRDYNDKVVYTFKIDFDSLSSTKNELLKYDLNIIDNCYIEKDI